MTDPRLLAEFDALRFNEKMILALLALIGEPVGRTAILDLLDLARIEDGDGNRYTVGTLDEAMLKLERLAYISVVTGRGFVCNPKLRWPAIRAAIGTHALDDLYSAYDELAPMRQTWNSVEPRSYRAGMARLRMGLLRGLTPQQIQPILAFCLGSYEAAQLHPIVDIFGRPFEPGMIALVNPLLQEDVLTVLLQNAPHEPLTAPVLREYCEMHLQRRHGDVGAELRMALAEDALLCGRLDDAKRYLEHTSGPHSQYLASVVVLLRGAASAAIAGFDNALKALRRDTGKRKQLFTGMGGHLYLLSLLRSGDPRHLKTADAYLDIAVRLPKNYDSAIHQQIDLLRQIRAGVMQAEAVASLAWEPDLQTQMFQFLLYFWLSTPQLQERVEQLRELVNHAERAGYLFIAAQAAAVATFGLAEASLILIETEGRQIVRFLEQELVQYVEGKVLDAAVGPLVAVVERAVEGMVYKGVAAALGVPAGGGGAGTAVRIEPEAVLSHAATLRQHADQADRAGQQFVSVAGSVSFE